MTTVTRPYIPPVAAEMSPGQERQWLLQIAQKLNLLLRRAATLEVTLEPAAAETIIYDERIGAYSTVQLQATSASAAAAAGIWISIARGAATIHHDVAAATDRTFTVGIIG